MNKTKLREALPSLLKLDGRPVVRPRHAAELLEISEDTLRTWMIRGMLRVRLVANEPILYASDLLEFEQPRRGRRPRVKHQPALAALVGLER